MANSGRAMCIIATLLIAPQHTSAQAAPKSLDELIRSAEATGASAARVTDMPAMVPRLFANDAAGSKERKCSDSRTVARGPLRSGEWVIGGNLSVDTYLAGAPLKIWWAPLHHGPQMHLLVRGQLAGSIADTVRYESRDVSWPGNTAVPESEREHFFPSGISFPKAGTWVVTVSQGPDWGCFVIRQNDR